MIKNKTILITGCNGEIGCCLIKLISKTPNVNIVALDLNISNVLNNSIEYISGSILDEKIIKKLFHTYDFDVIYHLAAVLSTKAEKKPDLAKDVNCNGTKLLIDYAIKKSYPTIFFFPSSIAIYSILEKKHTKHIHEDLYSNNPLTVYGKNKLFIEQYGIKRNNKLFDFRSLRFPGIISPFSIPTGGTSDYAPEMIHYAAQSLNYQCFASRDTTLPFIVMEDAICAITKFINTPRNQLTREVYNITSFSPTVEELYLETKKYFPKFQMTININQNRQTIIDSWPNYIDDTAARKDWSWMPKYDFKKAFEQYLVSQIINYYKVLNNEFIS